MDHRTGAGGQASGFQGGLIMPGRSSALRARLRWQLVAGLRSWAEGTLSDQAAVELMVSCSNGRFVRPGCAWIRPCARPGWYWLDAEALTAHAGTVAGSERRVLLLAAALVGGDPWTRRRWDESRRAVA
jgi:hypothetical protein